MAHGRVPVSDDEGDGRGSPSNGHVAAASAVRSRLMATLLGRFDSERELELACPPAHVSGGVVRRGGGEARAAANDSTKIGRAHV